MEIIRFTLTFLNAYTILLLFVLVWTSSACISSDLELSITAYDEPPEDKLDIDEYGYVYFKSQKHLVRYYKKLKIITSPEIEEVMLSVDRKNYLSGAVNLTKPYSNAPDGVGFGSIRNPALSAMVLEVLKNHLKEGHKAMDIGCGSGYLTTCMALMVGRTGYSVGVEYFEEDLRHANSNVILDKKYLYYLKRIKLVASEGDLDAGYFKTGPYEAIFFGSNYEGFPEKYPNTLLEKQLQYGGRMVVLIMRNADDYKKPKFIVYDKDFEGKITATLSAGKIAKEEEEEIRYQMSYLIEPVETTTEPTILDQFGISL